MTLDLVGVSKQPPRVKMYISEIPPTNEPGMVSGWEFVVEKYDEDGALVWHWDTWELRFSEIIRYPSHYCDGPMEWRGEDGKVVELEDFRKFFD